MNLDPAEQLVREMVQAHRHMGMKSPYAIAATAAVVGLTSRYIHAVIYRQAAPIKDSKAQTIRARFVAWLEDRIDAEQRKTDELIARRRKILAAMGVDLAREDKEACEGQADLFAYAVADRAGGVK